MIVNRLIDSVEINLQFNVPQGINPLFRKINHRLIIDTIYNQFIVDTENIRIELSEMLSEQE